MLSGLTPENKEYIPEQNFQYAYTEVDIEPESSRSHFDHFRKQSMFHSHQYIFSWSNLFTASKNENFGAKYKDKHIDKADYQFLIDPSIDSPNDCLTYSLLGNIL